MLLILALACADLKPTDTGDALTGTDATPLVGGRLVASGAGGVFVLDEASDTFRALPAAPSAAVNASGDTVTVVEADAIRVYGLDDGAVPGVYGLDGCPTVDGGASSPVDAVFHDGALLVACADFGGGATGMYRVEADGSTTPFPDVWAHGVQWDRGSLYLTESLGREGAYFTRTDPATLGPLADRAWLGEWPEARGEVVWWGWEGEPTGGLTVASVADTSEQAPLLLPEGDVTVGADVVEGELTFVAGYSYGTGAITAYLVDATGAVLDAVPGCQAPRLVWEGDGVAGWCTQPLTRIRWAQVDGAWERTGETTFSADVSWLQVVEEGD